MKKLLTGNEAVARGAFEAGVTVASAYPGTPSTEIFENLANYKEVYSEWAPNEKVAVEVAVGASMAGARSLSAMKHVGLNVAADPMFTFAYLGVNGGSVIVTADDPGMHSSQNEQDNRHYARHAKIPVIEPSDSQEAKDYIKVAYEISEKFDVPILFRMTTRVCHSKGLVELKERIEVPFKPYERNIAKFVATPAACRKHHVELEEKLKDLEAFSNSTELNREEINDTKIGIITSGVAYQYAREVFGNDVSYLKLGFSFPLPKEKIREFAEKVDKLFIIEELEPYIETEVKAMGIDIAVGKDIIPITGELNPDIIARVILGEERETISANAEKVIGRPPTLCAGCPHRGVFYALSKMKNVVINGDIGCYTLGCAEPLNAMDSVVCMGASVSAAHGFAKTFEKSGQKMKAFSVIGDSTFFHSGITSLIDVVYNKGTSTTIILDNRVTGMTGHQENPGTGYTLMGEPTQEIDLAKLVEAIGVKHIDVIDPNDLGKVREVLKKSFDLEEPSVIITRWPCALKKLHQEEKEEFDTNRGKYTVDYDKCKKCKVCLKVGCPAISFDQEKGSIINQDMCTGCSVCSQACPFDAIVKVGE